MTRLLFRFLGSLWLTVGSILAIISLGYILLYQAINNFFLGLLPPQLIEIANQLLGDVAPGFQQAVGIIFGLFCFFIGFALLTLRPWARTIGMVFHMAIGFCLAALTVLLFFVMRMPGTLANLIPQEWSIYVLLVGLVLALAMVCAGIFLSLPVAVEAFSGFIPTPPPMPPVKCPTCGGSMNLREANCPKCDAEVTDVPNRARLVSQPGGKEYPVSTRRQTRIGRDMPDLEVSVDDVSVSGDHAWIEFVDGHFYLHARKDTNGTYVNDTTRRVRDMEIRNNDLIVFGRAQFRFVVE
jgi:hypothetical protein